MGNFTIFFLIVVSATVTILTHSSPSAGPLAVGMVLGAGAAFVLQTLFGDGE